MFPYTNNSNVPIQAMVFIFYSHEISIYVETGLVTRHNKQKFIIYYIIIIIF
jgi:hypothetical protein